MSVCVLCECECANVLLVGGVKRLPHSKRGECGESSPEDDVSTAIAAVPVEVSNSANLSSSVWVL